MHVVNVPSEMRPLLQEIGRIAQQQGVAAYAVGGCVRDWLSGIDRTTDVDIAVVGEGIAFARALARACGTRATPHEQFGTATLTVERSWERARRPTRAHTSTPLRIDVASCRKETYAQPAAYPKVAAGTLKDDLFRRDFTINAMAMALAPNHFGALVDPFGGCRDLKRRRLRILHPRSFLDDPSRILRAARLTARFGLSLEPKTSQRLRQAVASGMLARLNRGRVRKEFERLIAEPDPLACLAHLGQWLRTLA